MWFEETGDSRNINHYNETKARLQKAEQQSYWDPVDDIIDVGDPEQEHQPKQNRFWSFVKSIPTDTTGVAPLKGNGKFHADPKVEANILNRQYESTWTLEDKSNIPTLNESYNHSPYNLVDIQKKKKKNRQNSSDIIKSISNTELL